jgi:N-methylhydantoinase B
MEVAVSHTTNRTKEGPPGIFEGRHGRPGRSIKNYDREDPKIVGGWSEDESWRICMFANLPIKEGEDITLELQGGGGWGNAFTRDPERVLEDVLDGYVSLEAAEKDYGVLIDPRTMTVNIEKTLLRRKNVGSTQN